MAFSWVHNYDLFLLDFDGLLVDTERLHHQAYEIMCQRRGLQLNWSFEKFCSIAHNSSTGIQSEIYSQFPSLLETEPDWLVLYKEKKKIYLNLIEEGHLKLMEGASEFLQALAAADRKRCVVTNSAKEQIECIRNKLPALQTIPHWITREDYKEAKPHPDGYIKAMSILTVEGDKVIGFEDSPRGVRSLIAAGSKAVMITASQDIDRESLIKEGVKVFPSFNAIPDTKDALE